VTAGGVAVLALGGVWLAGELVLQVRQWRRGRGGGRSEWTSLGVLVVAGFAAGFVAGPFHGLLTLPRPVALWAGFAIALVGMAVRFWAIVALGRFFRGVVTVQSDHEVVRRGPYRVIRHPSYLGALLGVLGFGLTSGSVAAALVMTAVLGLAFAYRIAVEERALRAGLGTAYEEYVATTGRLLPRLPGMRAGSDPSKPARPVVGNAPRS
jgi:protein-S-isoprenylcysteine O-methyltransferase Ste14